MVKSLFFVRWFMVLVGLFVLSSAVGAKESKVKSKVITAKSISEETSESKISLCVRFSDYVSNADSVEAKPYISLSPAHFFNVKLSYREVCLTGLKPGTDYSVTLNKEIPLGSAVLDKSYTFSATTTDYDPSTSFPEQGYILPAKNEITIPVETTNVDELSVSLYRINTNNLIGNINKHGLFRNLNEYVLKDIKNSDGYFLWEKRLKIDSEKNKVKTTAIPVGSFLKEKKPGVYVLHTKMFDPDGEEVYEYEYNVQWFMVSDIGLYTLTSDSGLHLYTKRLSTAKVYDGIRLELIAKNNEVLGTTVSKNGTAFFDDKLLHGKQGMTAKAIYAYGKEGDFSVLDLSRPAHDLSDRGVQGRGNPGHHDAFLYSNRGIYRPGERIDFHALIRDKLGEAEPGVPLSCKVFDSRQVEVSAKMLTTDALGHVEDSIKIAQSASTGKWRIALYSGGEKPIGTLSFLVEDFVPPKIKVELENEIAQLKPDEKSDIKVRASYLSGEPIADARVEVSTVLHRAKKPFKQYEAYHFGDAKESFRNVDLGSSSYETDDEGRVTIPYSVEHSTSTTLPLSAHIEIAVNEPGGRPVRTIIDQFFADKDAYIGIKPTFERASIDMEANPIFDIVYLKNSQLADGTLKYALIEEDVHWHWRSGGDGWEYYKTYHNGEQILTGNLTATESEPTSLKLAKLDWGSYRLELRDANEIVSSYRFSSGYEESISKSSPDRLPIAIDKKSYRVGEKLRVNVTPKFTGPVMVSIAHHDIVETKTVTMSAGKKGEVVFKVAENWGASAYVLATAFRAQSKKLGADRAIGVAHIAIDKPKRKIQLSLEHAKKTKSSTTVTVKVVAKGVANQTTHFTLAAVDEGVLNLTGYETPSPTDYFFGQQKLGIEIRDIYADLIKARGAHAKFNVGAGDDELAVALRSNVVANKRKVVALFTKVLTFNDKGVAEVTLDIPDYQGSLRLMALAWNKHATGATHADMVVKDSISPEYYMPRFISVGDEVQTLFTIGFDEQVAPGNYDIALTTEGGVRVDQRSFAHSVSAASRTKFSTDVTMHADAYRDGVITATISREGAVVAKKQWEIGVRTQYQQAHVREVGLLKKGMTLQPTALANPKVWSQIHRTSLTVSGKPLLPVASLTNELIDYCCRCAEQTTSRAMPWLFAPPESKHGTLVQGAVDRLLTYQKLNGSFGLWQSSNANIWVSSYVVDFLTRAKKSGYAVPDKNINLCLSWIENSLNRWSSEAREQEANAYALYVLARANRILMSEITFHANNPKSKITSAQAWGHLGAALAFVGEKKLGKKMFEKAIASLATYSGKNGHYYANYGGALRDETSLIVLMQESGLGLDWQSSFVDLAQHVKKKKYFSTQEMSLLLRLSYTARSSAPKKLKLSTGGKKLPVTKGEYRIKSEDLNTLPDVTNESDGASWYSFSFKATPRTQKYLSQDNDGFAIEKTIYSMEGNAVDLTHVAQNDRLVVVITGRVQSSAVEDPLVTDWAIAGFELENPVITGMDATTGLKWLGKQSSTKYVAYRNDRFIAALDLDSSDSSEFRIAYIVRAVSRGKFTLPAAKIEDMYQPHFRAFSHFQQAKMAILVIADAGSVAVKQLSEKEYLSVCTAPLGFMDHYTIMELNFLRNAIFAYAGLNFEQRNPALHQKFLPFTWYSRSGSGSGEIYSSLSPMQKANVQKLLVEEKRRAGGLVLGDFYRVHVKVMTRKDFAKFDKKKLHILLNSLVARYGVSFEKRDPGLHEIFQHMPWYKPDDTINAKILDQKMNDTEKKNVELILKIMKAL